VDSQGPPFPALEGLKVAQGLGRLHQAEGVRFPGDGQVHWVVHRELEEDPVVPASLVQLSRRVQEAWSISQRGCHPKPVPDAGPDRRQRLGMGRGRLQVSGQRHVIARLDSFQGTLQGIPQRLRTLHRIGGRLIPVELDSPIGTIEIAVRDGALCALKFEDGGRPMHEVLTRRFGDVEPDRLPAQDPLIARFRDYFDGDLAALDAIEVDTGGTAFQRSVWAQLRRIPAGETASYRDVAAAIGVPGAVRAVGTANGSNPAGIVIPCHRVIRSDGDLGGYGGGLDRKRWLLQHERAHARVAIPAGALL